MNWISTKEKDDKNQYLISGKYKVECDNELTVVVSKRKQLKDVKKEKKLIITSNKKCITFQKDLLKQQEKHYDSLTLLVGKYWFRLKLTKQENMEVLW